MICLDTNIAIYVINRRVPAMRLRLAEQLRLGTEIGFSVVALVALRYGRAQRQASGIRSPAGESASALLAPLAANAPARRRAAKSRHEAT
jgi:tRNA(fMet)-specific endonuclease VapC